MIIRYYDENRYNEFCCDKHADLFKPNELKENEEYKPNIMKPELDTRVDKFFAIVELYIEKINSEEEIVDFYKVLLLDLNPCLQKRIITVFYNYFSKDKIPVVERKKMLDNLLKNNMLEISEYALIISILDVRTEILKLFKLILDNKDLSEIYLKYLSTMKGENGLKNTHDFFADNSLPDKILINNGKDSQKLINYFNNEIYNKDSDTLWTYLATWLTYKSNPNTTNLSKSQKDSKNLKSNIFISEAMIDYCLLFLSKSSEKYIDLFCQ
jgi:hypothetical protein